MTLGTELNSQFLGSKMFVFTFGIWLLQFCSNHIELLNETSKALLITSPPVGSQEDFGGLYFDSINNVLTLNEIDRIEND